jgi:hypothetical protein
MHSDADMQAPTLFFKERENIRGQTAKGGIDASLTAQLT